jgi:hypothetical protein
MQSASAHFDLRSRRIYSVADGAMKMSGRASLAEDMRYLLCGL